MIVEWLGVIVFGQTLGLSLHDCSMRYSHVREKEVVPSTYLADKGKTVPQEWEAILNDISLV